MQSELLKMKYSGMHGVSHKNPGKRNQYNCLYINLWYIAVKTFYVFVSFDIDSFTFSHCMLATFIILLKLRLEKLYMVT